MTRSRIAVLGSTGSVGTSCLDVLRNHQDTMQLVAITANSRWRELEAQTREFEPRWAVVSDESLRNTAQIATSVNSRTEWLWGAEHIESVASHDEVDTVIAAIVGAAGLRGTWAAIESGKRVGIANKETLVVAGPLVMDLAARSGAELLPVDSEHCAVFQALQAGRRQDVKRIVLTASGGPFRGRTTAQLADVTVAQALDHPTWNMGPKITVDSATMMNKALEIIEARWLFGVEADQIGVVIHPQSIIHSFVEFVDGSVIAQLSPPDMKLPIQYALTYPERVDGISPKMDWSTAVSLELEPPDLDAFPALELGFQVARSGGTSGAVLNAANEVAVERFLSGQLRFLDIPRACRAILNQHEFDPSPSLDDLLRQDQWAREETLRWKS
ncbi:MAG: 1-deoxy-D-xylulose-5-phosphate reductoisomerase [Planctomycetota bacterium]|nr:1-deoxy-D-xylulose-5-phosphate reductoisomerase [Planctomycetota bacterium]